MAKGERRGLDAGTSVVVTKDASAADADSGERGSHMDMLKKLVRSTTFRLAGFYILIFGVSAAGLLSFVYWRSTVFTAQQIDGTIAAEIQGLEERYLLLGMPGLTEVVAERSRNNTTSLYLLVGPEGQRIAGNIRSWPLIQSDPNGWVDFSYGLETEKGIEQRAARGRVFRIAGGFSLLAGVDVQQREDLLRLIESAYWWATAGILALGLVGGVLISRQALRRVDGISAVAQEIMEGDLARRVPVDGSGDELDRLADSLNAMLDRIEGLMNAVRQVSDNIAHDLRTPLNRLRARAEVALMGQNDTDDYREALQKTLNDADTLLATFNALLDIARLEGSAGTGPSDRVDLADIVADVSELYDPVAEEAAITLLTEASPGEAFVIGDRRLLSQAVANLIDNAIKYTPAGGTVSVQASRGPKRTTVVVSDNGPGVPDADRNRIFDRFVRLEADRGKPGNGLGLSLVRAVAAMHNARIIAEDAKPGLRVVFSLPPAPSAPSAPPASTAIAQTSGVN